MVGALGEVGRSLGRALRDLDHEIVPVSSRPMVEGSDVVPLDEATDAIASGGIELVVHAGGRGDKRVAPRDPLRITRLVGEACEEGGVRGVLVSTLRVLESASGSVSGAAPADCNTDYARANAMNEREWLSAAPSQGHVLRLANYLCAPAGLDSPQAKLLPWSLVTEALSSGRITVRSAPTVARDFVSAVDVARAVLLIAREDTADSVCATVPAFHMDLQQMTDCVRRAFEAGGFPEPLVTFGTDEVASPALETDWLAANGWACSLTEVDVRHLVGEWLSDHGAVPR